MPDSILPMVDEDGDAKTFSPLVKTEALDKPPKVKQTKKGEVVAEDVLLPMPTTS